MTDDERFMPPSDIITSVDPTEPSDEEARRIAITELMETYHIAEPWSSAELDAADIKTTFLVDSVLVEGQPGGIAGPQKSLKTTISIDLALSLGRPCKFLGRFWVPEAKRVLFLSAESGEGTIQETARRIAEAKGFNLRDDASVTWGFWVPKAKNAEQLEILDFQLEQSQAEVAIIDPLYHVLDGEDAANLSMNGQQLQAVAQRCLQHGVTPVLVDHVKRSSQNAKDFQPLELHDVSGAGKAEFFRQWLLLGRREKFNPEEPVHRLWMTVGGSAGHCGLWAVTIDESRDEETQNRTWGVTVETASEAIDEDRREKERQRAKEAEQKIYSDARKILQKWPEDSDEILTPRKIRAKAALGAAATEAAVDHLLAIGKIETATFKAKNRQEYEGFKRC